MVFVIISETFAEYKLELEFKIVILKTEYIHVVPASANYPFPQGKTQYRSRYTVFIVIVTGECD